MKELFDLIMILSHEIRELKLHIERIRTNKKSYLKETWIDNQEVMQMLHISQRTLQTLRSNGTIPYSKIKGKFYYKVTDIERILESNYSNPKIRDQDDY